MAPKRKPSKMWKHFTLSDCKKKATCKYCHNSLSYTMATMSNLGRHLKSKHPEVYTTQKEEPALDVYTMEEDGNIDDLKTYKITLRGFEDMEHEEIIPELRDHDWTPRTSEEWKIEAASAASKEKKERKRSAVWDHFEKTPCKTSGICRHCGKKIRLGTVSNMARHLRQKHPTTPFSLRNQSNVKEEDTSIYDGQEISMIKSSDEDISSEVVEINVNDIQQPVTIIQTTPVEIISNVKHLETQSIEVNDANITQSSQTELLEETEDFDINDYIRPSNNVVHTKEVDTKLVKMIVKGCHNLNMVEQTAFKDFVKLLNPKYQIPSANKIASVLIPDCYREVEKRSTSSLRDAEGICLYLDQWKSKSNTYICIMAHFINTDCKFESLFLSCHVLVHSENSTDLYERLIETVHDWGITDKIIAVMSDNSEIISEAVRMSKWSHIPHFLNSLKTVIHESLLTIKPTLFKVTTLIEELTALPETIAAIYLKQKNLCLQPVKLIKKVNNGWNSAFSTVEMLTRIVKLKTAVCQVHESSNGIKLTENEWKILNGIVKLFGIFKAVKKELMKEKRVAMSKIIFYIRLIKKEIVRTKELSKNPPEVTYAATIAENAMSDQFKDLDNIDLVTNVLLLDPRLKKYGFDDESESASACSKLKKEVCETFIPDEWQQESELDPNSMWYWFDSEVKKLNAVKDPIGKGILELENYLQEQLLHRDEDPLVWWKERCAIYPRLYKLAKRYLCVTAKCTARESISFKSAYMLAQLKSCNLSPTESEVMFLHHNM